MRGFSLVELSIVLVILGLLTGGILAGQSLIRASELRAVTTEYQRYAAATNTFRDKYFAIPGDFRDATKFWLRQTGTADCATNSSAAVNAAGACDGDGNGAMTSAPAASQAGERFQYWRQLALAGLIEGTYAGTSGAAGVGDCPIGTNCPKSKLGNAGWGAWVYTPASGGSATEYAGMSGPTYLFGTYYANAWPANAALKPEEAWNIDTKMDDGKPGAGKMIARETVGFGVANSCTTSASQTDYAGNYNLSVSAVNCALFFTQAY